MYIKEAHIMIEQGLQNIGVFAHYDVDTQEVDIAIKQAIWKMMNDDFPNPKGQTITKTKQDKYSILLEKEKEFAVTLNSRGDYEANLLDDYFHMIKADSVVLYECGRKPVKSGDLIEGEWYQNIGTTPITYNSVSIPIRKIFQATNNKVYSSAINTTPKVIKLKRRISPNRFQDEEFITHIKNNDLSKSTKDSPLSVIGDKKIFTSVNNFFIEKQYISYLRKPSDPNFNFRKYTLSDTLQVGTVYEVVSGTVTYNGVSYINDEFILPSFTVVAGVTSFTGTGNVRVKSDGDIKLKYEDALKVVEMVIIKLSTIGEQPQQKIQNLAQLNRP